MRFLLEIVSVFLIINIGISIESRLSIDLEQLLQIEDSDYADHSDYNQSSTGNFFGGPEVTTRDILKEMRMQKKYIIIKSNTINRPDDPCKDDCLV